MTEPSPKEEPEKRIAELEAKVEELRRVNAELARELRRGAASRRPRSPVAAGSALAKLTSERDTAQAELEQARAELRQAEEGFEGLRLEAEGLRLEAEQLRGEAEQMRGEAERLRSGRLGVLRRIRARLLRR
jgi:predicted  nucleic acid-binding Zn-ribbon protein